MWDTVGRLNPRWNAPALDREAAKAREEECFERASALTGAEFADVLDEIVNAWLPARDAVETALLARSTVHSSGQILCFESGGMPWKSHLYELERQHGVDPLVMFVLFTDQAGMWRMQDRHPAHQPSAALTNPQLAVVNLWPLTDVCVGCTGSDS